MVRLGPLSPFEFCTHCGKQTSSRRAIHSSADPSAVWYEDCWQALWDKDISRFNGRWKGYKPYQADGDDHCPYCGSRFREDAHRCDGCGATRQ